ncbi:hypothetical protein QVD17_16812 [Tagetes erecta]|uniref:Uncharacterized protein n=1 Tax=Tagetes erecta TaxID=13708 RepID=A0AAD8KUT1_TARER|nr:hypothetical protein QVD17_16812 [Tagetes erecta]
MPSSSSSIPMSSSSLGLVKIKDVTNKKPSAVYQGSKPYAAPSTPNFRRVVSNSPKEANPIPISIHV